MLGSVAVIVAALIIKFIGWTVVDPILAVLIGLWVLPRTWTLLREAGHLLLNGVPKGVDLVALRNALAGEPGNSAVNHLRRK